MGLGKPPAKSSLADVVEPDADDASGYDDDAVSTAQDSLENADFSPDQAAALISAMKVVCSAMK